MNSHLAARPSSPWISRSSILILSGILIGFGVQQPVSTAMHASILGAGTVGLFAFLGLELVAKRRADALTRHARERQTWKLQARMHKHIPHRKPHSLLPPVPASDSSWIAVPSRRA